MPLSWNDADGRWSLQFKFNCKLQNTVASFLNRYSIILSSFIESYLIEFHQSFWGFPLFQPLLLPTINRKVLTIPEGYLTREVQFDMGLQVQDKKYHHKVRLQSSFESKSEQDSCVWPVTRDSIWHLDLKMQDMKYHHKVRMQSSFQSKSEQDSCVGCDKTINLTSGLDNAGHELSPQSQIAK